MTWAGPARKDGGASGLKHGGHQNGRTSLRKFVAAEILEEIVGAGTGALSYRLVLPSKRGSKLLEERA
jgi:hypothetical protein